MTSAADLKFLSQTRLFWGVPLRELEASGLRWHRKNYAAGAVLMAAGTPGELLYVIKEGSVKVHLEAPDGSEAVIGLRGVGEALGEMTVLESEPRSATVTTLEPCVLLWTSSTEFETYALASPKILVNLTRIVSARLRIATAQILSLSGMDVRGRMACQLLALAREYDRGEPDGAVSIPIRITQTGLGAMVGASRASVNNTLCDWKRRGLIAADSRHHFTVLDRAALEKEIG